MVFSQKICRLAMACLITGQFFCSASMAGLPSAESAPNYLIHVWQTDKGLPQNWVSSIAQTPDGYLWVGTRYGGLARFDGVRFVQFNQLDTRELKDVQVEYLSVDKTGRLWIVMGNESVSAFSNGRFELFRAPRSQPRLRADHVLINGPDSVLFAGEPPYLVRLDLSGNKRWSRLDPPAGLIPDPQTFCADQNDNVWFIAQRNRLGYFSKTNFCLLTNGLPEKSVNALAVNLERKLWIATPHHLVAWDGTNFCDRTPTNGPPPENILQIRFSGDDGLWVLEKKRLRKFLNGRWVAEILSDELLTDSRPGNFSLHGDAQGNAWLIVNGLGLWHCKSDGTAHLLTEQTGLPSRFISCWFQDAEGGVWIGLHGGGIARIRERLFQSFGQTDGLPDKVVSSTCVDADGNLWAGTMSGEVARRQNGKFSTVPLPWLEGAPNPSATVFPADDRGMWVGSLNHGLSLFRNGTFSLPITPWDSVRVLFQDSRRRLWVGALVNLYCLTNGGYTTYGSANGFVDLHAIGAIAEDAAGAIWIVTGPGELWKFYDGKFSRFTPPADWPSVRFAAVLPDTNGVVWIGTLGGGLLRFSQGQFTRLLKTDGLPDNNVPQLLDSHDGFLWGGTYAGIFRANKKDLEAVADGKQTDLQCRTYGEFDGLPALECSSGFHPSCWRSADGRLWFATANGVTSVDPAKTAVNQIPPTVIIEEMLVDGKSVDVPPRIGVALKNARTLSPLKISPGQHYIQFRFTGLSFAAPDGVRFRVRLEGGDGRWQDVGGRREFGCGPLLPGEYHFHVAACNSDGVWNTEGDTLAFAVGYYFWETPWFKVVLGVATLVFFAAAGAVFQRRRYHRRLERVERQREMERERTRIARDLHDDLGTSLTQIGMLSALANRETTPADEAKDLIKEVRGRAREMVIALDEIVWAVNPKNDSLMGLLSYLGHFAEEFFHASGIRFRLDIPPEVPAVALTAEVRHHLFLAFKEAVNNAVRHSGATQVSVRAEILPDEAVIHIEDNGRGFDGLKPESSGNGLANMNRRLEQVGGRTELNSASSSGTTITFHVPIKAKS